MKTLVQLLLQRCHLRQLQQHKVTFAKYASVHRITSEAIKNFNDDDISVNTEQPRD